MMGRSHEEAMIELLRERPGVAVELVKLTIEDSIPAELAIVMRQITAAGYDVSVTPKPALRKRAKPVAAKTAKAAKRQPAFRSRSRGGRAVAAAAAVSDHPPAIFG